MAGSRRVSGRISFPNLLCLILVFCAGGIVPGNVEASDVPHLVSGAEVVVSANASDDVGVAGVLFLLDGSALGAEIFQPPYSIVWDTTLVEDGTYTLAARARDLAGNQSVSDLVEVVVDNQPEPDTVFPTITTTSPADGATVSGNAAVTADADDDVGVAGVQFFVDGAALGPEDTLAPWEAHWDTTTVPNGTHVVVSRARDAAGNTTEASEVRVTVDNTTPDTTAPRVTTKSPSDGTSVSGSVALVAEASDDVAVAWIQFLIDGSAFGPPGSGESYSVTWDTTAVADGVHTIATVARDEAGNEAVSSRVSIEVANDSAETGEGDPPPDPDESPGGEDALPPLAVDSIVEVTLERSADSDSILIRSRSEMAGVRQLELFIDGHPAGTHAGDGLAHKWDTELLLGRHDLQIVAYDEAMEVVASSSVYQFPVVPPEEPGMKRGAPHNAPPEPECAVIIVLEQGAEPGTLRVRGGSNLDDVRMTEVYIDGQLVSAGRNGKPAEFNWVTGPVASVHEILVVVYDRTGILSSATLERVW